MIAIVALGASAAPSIAQAPAATAGGTAKVRVTQASIGPVTFTVNSTADTTPGSCDPTPGGDCTLREAILAANAHAGEDTIAFNIQPFALPQVIGVTSDLPDITEAVILDGTTQPGYGAMPVIVLDGMASTGPNGWGISITSNGITVRGLCLHRFFTGSAIVLRSGASENEISGNFIGTDHFGTMAIGTLGGIELVGADMNTIGGDTFLERNVVSGTSLHSILLREGSDHNQVWGNLVGLDAGGGAHLPNAGHDLAIFDSMGNDIGGPVPFQRNVFAGNSNPLFASVAVRNGVDSDPMTNSIANNIHGNYIGTDQSGSIAFGSAGVGIQLENVSTNNIGFPGLGANVIGGSDLDAVRILGSGAINNVIHGNRIGLGANGTSPLPIGGNGVHISQSAQMSMVQENLITNAAANGVLLLHDAGVGNRITKNQIFGNGLLGIDLLTAALDPGGPTPNDAGDSDTGPNDLQNFPVIAGISGTGDVVGTVSSTPSTFVVVEVFQSPTCDPSGFGEAATFVGTANVIVDGAGDGPFAVTPLVALSPGSFLTATAIGGPGNTSELSACFLVPPPALFEDGFESGDTSAWSLTDSGNP